MFLCSRSGNANAFIAIEELNQPSILGGHNAF
jgi:hypothetical protein